MLIFPLWIWRSKWPPNHMTWTTRPKKWRPHWWSHRWWHRSIIIWIMEWWSKSIWWIHVRHWMHEMRMWSHVVWHRICRLRHLQKNGQNRVIVFKCMPIFYNGIGQRIFTQTGTIIICGWLRLSPFVWCCSVDWWFCTVTNGWSLRRFPFRCDCWFRFCGFGCCGSGCPLPWRRSRLYFSNRFRFFCARVNRPTRLASFGLYFDSILSSSRFGSIKYGRSSLFWKLRKKFLFLTSPF